MPLILSLDLGTSAVKCLLLDERGEVLQTAAERYPSQTPRPGWIEQRPDDWVAAAVRAAGACLAERQRRDVAVISLSGHMSGLVLVDREGAPLSPCITLSDTRSSAQTERIRGTAGPAIASMTGNPVIDAFLAPKLVWMKENFPDLYGRAHRLLFPKDYLRYRLTGAFATDATDAGNSLLLDPVRGEWNTAIADKLGIRASLLPRVLRPYDIAGKLTGRMAGLLRLPAGIPVVAGAADMAAGALGTGTVEPGDTALTIGTSATLLTVVPHIGSGGFGRVTYHPHALPDTLYALGSHFSGGLSLNWFSAMFRQKIDYAYLQSLGKAAEDVPPGSRGAMFLPHLAGSGSPHFEPHMRGAYVGLSPAVDQAALFRATLEGVACNANETLTLLAQMYDAPREIRVGGGGVRIGLWPSILAGVFGCPVKLLKHADASALGAAILGGYGVGLFADLRGTSRRIAETTATIEPEPGATAKYERLSAQYADFYQALSSVHRRHAPR